MSAEGQLTRGQHSLLQLQTSISNSMVQQRSSQHSLDS